MFGSNTSITVGRPQNQPGSQFRVVIDCNEGRKWSRWADQRCSTNDDWVRMNCPTLGLRLVDIQFR